MPSVKEYFSDYRNTILMVTYKGNSKKLDPFVNNFNYCVKVDVPEANRIFFETSSIVALNIDSGIWRAKKIRTCNLTFSSKFSKSSPVKMRSLTRKGNYEAQKEQLQNDLLMWTCFSCHKVGCRFCKCSPTSRINNNNGTTSEISKDSSILLSNKKIE